MITQTMTAKNVCKYFAFGSLLFLTSCDPARVFVISAKNKGHVAIEIYGNSKLLPAWEQTGKEEKIIIKVPAFDSLQHSEISYFYGVGGWNDAYLSDFSKNIDSICIHNSKGSIRLKKAPEIETYLKKHRHGLFKPVLKLRAK